MGHSCCCLGAEPEPEQEPPGPPEPPDSELETQPPERCAARSRRR